MLEYHYTMFIVEARRKHHIEHVLICLVGLHIFKTFLFYQSSMCEKVYNFHLT